MDNYLNESNNLNEKFKWHILMKNSTCKIYERFKCVTIMHSDKIKIDFLISQNLTEL